MEKKLKDKAKLSGNTAGLLPRNKTGDIICEVDGRDDLKIAIECKFDKSLKLGDISSKDIFIRKTDTAWSQLIEADANRNSKVSIIVFDISLIDKSILKRVETVGFISVIDSQKGDYNNLAIAYMLARDIAINARRPDIDTDLLSVMVNRIIKDIEEIRKIKSLIETNITTNREILLQLEKSMMLMEFNSQFLSKFLLDGTLTKKDMLDFYIGEDVREKFKLVEKEISDY